MEDIKKAVEIGVRKVNVGSILKKVYFQNIKESAQELSFESNPYEVVGSGFEKDINVKARIELQKAIEMFMMQYGSNNKA